MSFSFQDLVSEIHKHQGWRALADKCARYYDGDQLTPQQLITFKNQGKADIVENLIHAPVNSVLGSEAQRRRDWMVVPDDDDSSEVAEALNAKLNEHLRLCEANSRCSEAYASQVKSGIGWLLVRRNDDPFGTPYKIEFVHRDEIAWDMSGRQQDLSDVRWLARRRYMDIDEAKEFIPEVHHPYIDLVASRWQMQPDNWEFAREAGATPDGLLNQWRASQPYAYYFLDSKRKRVAIFEVYYRVYETVKVIEWSEGKREQFDENSEDHLLAILTGEAVVNTHRVKRIRRKWFVGMYEIADEPSPYPHTYFPYIPFFGYREDSNNAPYGIIRMMLDPQDAYNNTTIRIQHILSSKRIVKDEDATDMEDDQLLHEVNRKDGVITLRNGKTYGQHLFIEQDWNELVKLYELRESHKMMVRDCAGIYNAFSGREAGQQSGVAIASLVEQGSITLAEINDNYEYARMMLARLMMAYLVNDIGANRVEVNLAEQHGQSAKTIVLNEGGDQSDDMGFRGKIQLNNAVTLANYQVVLAPVQSAVGYRQHLYMRVMEMFTSAPDALKLILMPIIIELSDLPKREQVLKQLNQMAGMNADPEQAQQQAEQQQAVLQAQQQTQQLAMMQAQADIEVKKAKAALDQAQAAKLIADIEQQREQQQLMASELKSKLLQQAKAEINRQRLARL